MTTGPVLRLGATGYSPDSNAEKVQKNSVTASVKVAKNNAPPFRIAEFDIIFKGVSTLGCIVDLAEETGVVRSLVQLQGDNISKVGTMLLVSRRQSGSCPGSPQQVRQKLEMGAVSANSVAVSDEEVEDMGVEAEE